MNNELIVGLDIDGVLRDFTKGLSSAFLKKYPQFKEEDLHPADRWDYFIKYPWDKTDSSIKTEEDIKQAALDFVFNSEAKEIFQNSPIYDNTLESVDKLKDFCKKSNIQLRIISHQTTITKMHTLVWLAKHNLCIEQYFFVNDHSHKWFSCDVMIDDSPIVLSSKLDGCHSIKINHLYNKEVHADFELDKFSEIEKAFDFLTRVKNK